MRCLLFALICTAVSPHILAQAPVLGVGTEIVLVDVTVTDSHGQPVHQLSPADFSVTEDGKQQSLAHAEEHAALTAAQVAKAPQMPDFGANVYTNFPCRSKRMATAR